MKTKLLFLASTVFLSVNAYSQVGINTSTPSSTLDIRGSIEGNFREITGTNTLDNKDYHVSFSGTTDAVLNLPAKSTTDGSMADFRGRKYYIKNNSTSSKLTLTAASGQTIRLGGNGTASNTLDLKPGKFGFLTANGVNGWDLDFVATAYNDNWVLANSDINGPVITSQAIPTGTTYTTANNCSVTVTIPSGVASSKVVLNFTGWGHAGTSTGGGGSLRFQIVQSGTAAATYSSVMMTSWASPVGTPGGITRFNFPVVYSISNLPAGTYTFNLQTVREDETGAGIGVIFWGTMGRADVFIKD